MPILGDGRIVPAPRRAKVGDLVGTPTGVGEVVSLSVCGRYANVDEDGRVKLWSRVRLMVIKKK